MFQPAVKRRWWFNFRCVCRVCNQAQGWNLLGGVGALDWTIYILRCADGTLYTGITNDLARRVSAHETGQGAKYTKGRGPFQLVYNETCEARGTASRRENEIKSLSRDEKLKLVTDGRS